MDVSQRNPLPWLASAGVAVAVGGAVAISSRIAFLLILAMLALAALAAPASVWVLGALVASLTFKGLGQLHLLPSIATFVDLPLSWGALAVGLMRMRPGSQFRSRMFRWLGLLAFAMAVSWAFNPSEVLRPVLYLMLLGEPFAIVCALLADPPSPRMRRVLEASLLALILIQVPLAALQLVTLGPADRIQGTLYGAGAGAHVISAVVIVGAIWILNGGGRLGRFTVWRIPILVALVLLPFVADAKQVIAATPALFLAMTWRGGRTSALVRAALIIAMVVALFTLDPAGRTGLRYIGSAAGGHGGKEAAAGFVWQKLHGDPAAIAFGRGPAETVSRAAFETIPAQQLKRSPLESLGLKPAVIAGEAQAAAQASSPTDATSVDTGISSTLGVLGDLGIFGLIAYGGLALSLFLRLRHETSPEGVAAASGFALFLVLGLIFDWWEQPPFSVVLGLLAGLALTAEDNEQPGAAPIDGQPINAVAHREVPPIAAGTAARQSATVHIDRVHISGIVISAVAPQSAVAEIDRWIRSGSHAYACCTTAEGLIRAQRDSDVRRIYNQAGLTIPDGVPGQWVDRLAGARIDRVRSVDFLLAVCALAAVRGWHCYFYGSDQGTCDRLVARLVKRFPQLQVAGSQADASHRDVVAEINATDSDLVLVGLPTPEQEHWLAASVDRLDAPALIGVGLAFEFIGGLPPQPPPLRLLPPPTPFQRAVQFLRPPRRPRA